MPRRILVVDDEEDELAAWDITLRKAGYFVRTASTATRALELCDEFMFDLVMLDYVMPKMKGLELLARIREKNPLVRSILVSARLNVPEQEVREAIRGEAEADRYLHKPIKNEQLIEAVGEVLKEDGNRAWADIAKDQSAGKGGVTRAKGAQSRLNKHIKKG